MDRTQPDNSYSSTASHKGAQRSSTLNRKYVKRPQSPSKSAGNARTISVTMLDDAQPTAAERKDRAVRQALRSVNRMNADDNANNGHKSKSLKHHKASGNGKRLALAFACAAVCVAALVAVVNYNTPDLSVRVAAMQTGIDASYPSYVPREYSLSNISSSTGKLSMTFSGPSNASFTLTQEKSSWDSTALLNNYVKPTWGENYTTTHEQGITIYMSGSSATWVNGGILYTIETSGSNLTKKQIRSIAVSL